MSVRDLLIVGAGPSGLSAAIAAKRCGLDYQVIEQGGLVDAIYRFPPQMVFFTTPELLEIGGVPFVSPYEKPTRAEALRYYRRVADVFDLQIAFGESVLSISTARTPSDSGRGHPTKSVGKREEPTRSEVPIGSAIDQEDDEPRFVVETRSSQGVRRARYAQSVVLATGYYDHPNRLGIEGENLLHVHHYYNEPHLLYRKRVVIVGGGNSAAESALEMFRAGGRVTLVHRSPQLKATIKYWVRPDIENRIKEGSIAARFETSVTEIRPSSVMLRGANGVEELPADAVFLLTGYHPDWDLQTNAGIELDDRRAPIYDSETFETTVPGLFVAGGALAGIDTGTIFIENGRFHGEKIVEVIAARSRL